jgi:regulatory protein
MPIVTEIKNQVKNHEKASVYIDGKYTFSLTIAQLAEHKKIRINSELTEAEVSEYKKLSSLTNQYVRMVGLIYARPRSEYEVRTKLKSKKLEPEEIEEIIAKLKSAKYLDDEKFAQWWVSGRKASRPISKLKLRAELARKGINSNLAEEAIIKNFSSEEELAILKSLIEKKKEKYPDQQKLLQFLASKGFSYSQIKEALKDSSDSF